LSAGAPITEADARAIAQRIVDEASARIEGGCVIVDAATQHKPWGWVFVWHSRRWLETHDIRHMVFGNGPIVVMLDGSTHQLGTHLTTDQMIRQFEIERGFRPPDPPQRASPGPLAYALWFVLLTSALWLGCMSWLARRH